MSGVVHQVFRDIAECQELVRECAESLGHREAEIVAQMKKARSRTLVKAVTDGGIKATLAFVGTLLVTVRSWQPEQLRHSPADLTWLRV